MTLTNTQRIAALERQASDLVEAFRTYIAFRDNHEVWLKEMGIWDRLIQDVLSRVPITSSGAVSSSVVVDPGDLTAKGFDFAANGEISGFRMVSMGSPEGPIYGFMGMNDAGFRVLSGVRVKPGSSWPDIERNGNLPIIFHAIERDGGISWDYEPGVIAGDANPRPRKTFIMYLGGFRKLIGPRAKDAVGRFLDFCSLETGRGFRFNTFPAGGSASGDISTALQLDPDNPNAAVIRVGDQLRRIVLGADGNLKAGEVVDESQ